MTRRPILITGSSGGGKTALLAEMVRRGWATMPEPGRRVIAAERKRGGDGLPWQDMPRFLQLCSDFARADWASVRPGITLFDRGLVDAFLAQRRLGLSARDTDISEWFYDPCVIMAPPWRALFKSDEDRQHSFEAACEEYRDLTENLPKLGYQVHHLPKAPIVTRADSLESLLRTG